MKTKLPSIIRLHATGWQILARPYARHSWPGAMALSEHPDFRSIRVRWIKAVSIHHPILLIDEDRARFGPGAKTKAIKRNSLWWMKTNSFMLPENVRRAIRVENDGAKDILLVSLDMCASCTGMVINQFLFIISNNNIMLRCLVFLGLSHYTGWIQCKSYLSVSYAIWLEQMWRKREDNISLCCLLQCVPSACRAGAGKCLR